MLRIRYCPFVETRGAYDAIFNKTARPRNEIEIKLIIYYFETSRTLFTQAMNSWEDFRALASEAR